jgi:DUF4097 and DUF4098 domain-containing protein YvlB
MRPKFETPVASPSRAERAELRALWILVAAGLALLLAASVASGESATVTRTDRFDATLSPGTLLRVENVNGDVVASSGRAFSATVTITVTAATKSRAQEILDGTRVDSSSGDGAYRLETLWPGASGPRSRDRHRTGFDCRDCRISSRYELVLPPGVAARLQTVNGEVRVRDHDGDVEAHSVNGNVLVSGTRRSLRAQTVNGRVEASAQALPSAATWDLETVNGSVVATLPRDAGFRWNATTMSGSIASTFALPPLTAEAPAAPEPIAAPAMPRAPRAAPPAPRARSAEVEDEDGELLVDTEEISREVEDSLREVEVVVHDHEKAMRDHEKAMGDQQKAMREIRVVLPQQRYAATVAGGGATLRTSTLNGSITLLAAGTREGDAKPLVSGRRSIVVTVPRVDVRVPDVHVRVPRVHVEAPPPMMAPPAPDADEDEIEIVRGDIAGDFLSTSNGSYRLGHVSGRVKILTNSGEIHLASAGKGADLKTFGGDIMLGPVLGDLKAQTMAGEIRVGPVTGSATVETSGGDIRIERVSGIVVARTGGGDVILPAVAGSVRARTGGGEVRVGIVSRVPKDGIVIRNEGGDVLLTLPSDAQADLDLRVEGPTDPGEVVIRSDFPGVAISRGEDAQRAVGTLNGGGARITVRTSSGSIRLRKGPAAGS